MTDILNKFKAFLTACKAKWVQFRERYPRAGLFVKYSGILMLAGIGFILALFLSVRIGLFGRLPDSVDLTTIHHQTASEVYSADSVLIGKYYIENRKIIEYDDIPIDLVNALIATEDARFLEHSGIDLRAWARVFVKTVLLSDLSSGGGSTISQQLAKNLFPRQNYWILSIPVNKIKEMYIARRLEKVYSKNELLSLYLNSVPFGGNMFGVEVAANQIFSTSVNRIKTEEAATLVGMLKANTYYSPVRHPDRARQRRNVVLEQMAKYGYLEQELADSLQLLPLEVKYQQIGNREGIATYFREQLRQELGDLMQQYTKADGTPYNLYTDGLRIYTTIDSRMQRYAEAAVKEHMASLQKDFDAHWKGRAAWGGDDILEREKRKSARYKSLAAAGVSEADIDTIFQQPVKMRVYSPDGDVEKEMSPLDSIKFYYTLLNAGLLVMEPHSGDIRAWVGGIDYQYFQYDHVRSSRQVGSTFKPIVYAAAIQNGFFPCDYYYNRLVTYTAYEDWQPGNSDGEYGGVYSMAGALSKSVNAVAVDLIVRTGVDKVRALAKKMGVTVEIPKAPSIALGTADIPLYDMIKVYGTLANRGKRPEPRYITTIADSKGKTIAKFESDPEKFERVLSLDESDIITNMMQGVVDSGTAKRLRYQYGLYTPIAGKTGTTQSQADGWFIGFTPRLVAGVWVGGEYPSVRFRSTRLGQGANTALPIWARFMKKVYADKAFAKYKYDAFAPLSPEAAEALDCDPFYEDMEMAEEGEEEEGGLHQAIDALLGVFRKKDKEDDNEELSTNVNPRTIVIQEEQEARSEEIREKNRKIREKRERRQKRKENWDKLFKKN